MPEYLRPGVYIEETERGPRPIEGVPTSTAAFLGEAERGPIEPTLVTSALDYRRRFGDSCGPDKFLPDAVAGFFGNGGKRLYVCRIVGSAAATAQASFGDWFAVRAAGAGSWGTRTFARIDDSTMKDSRGVPIGFRIRLTYWSADSASQLSDPFEAAASGLPLPQLTEDYDNLVMDAQAPNFFGKHFPFIDLARGHDQFQAGASPLAILVRRAGAPDGVRPTNGGSFLSGGSDGPDLLGPDDYAGHPAGDRNEPQGLAALEENPFREVSLVYAPAASTAVARALIEHCERLRFRFAVIDAPQAQLPRDLDPRTTMPADTSYAAFYYPWIVISDSAMGVRKLVPPGGHVFGMHG